MAALNPLDGQPLWKADAQLGEGPAWIVLGDLDGDKLPDVIAAGNGGKVVALAGTDGKPLWEYPGSESPRLSALAGAPALADTDDDGAVEIYVAGKEGVLSLDALGHERFFAPLDAAPIAAPVVGDTDDDGRYEMYVLTPGAKLNALDAQKGGPLWDLDLAGETAASPQLALADLDQDEKTEILVAGAQVNVVSTEGKLVLTQPTATAGVAIGDINSDGELEIVTSKTVAAPLGKDDCGAPVLADMQGAAVLGITGDNVLHAVRTGARLMPTLAPWTSPRRDASGRASAASAVKEFDALQGGPQLAAATQALSIAGGFEEATQAAEWKAESGTAARDEQVKAAGAASLLVTPGTAEARVASPPATVSPDLRTVNASVLAKGAGARAFLAWEIPNAKPVLQELRPADTTPEGWRRLRISGAVKPFGAANLRMVLVSAPGAPTNWDEVQATAQRMTVPYVEIYGNQLGYELKAPKRFTAASTFSAPQAKFRVINEHGNEVYAGNTEPPARILGAGAADWGKYFWRGDFTAFDEPGKYKIQIEIDGNIAQTATFEIGQDILWSHLYNKLVGAITARRCTEGEKCAESHCAWGSPSGGCDDARALLSLTEDYTMILWRIYAHGQPLPALADEIKWGADHVLAQAETSGHAGQAIAGVARLFPQEKKYADYAREQLVTKNANADVPIHRFRGLLDLYVATHDETLLPEIKKLYPGPDITFPDSIVRYESEVDEMVLVSFDLGKKLSERADAYLKLAENPFGVCAREDQKQVLFFTSPRGSDYVYPGNTGYLLEVAGQVAQAYRYNAKPEYQQFILDQLNWVLGNNPFGTSFVEDVGTKNLASYTHPEPKFPRGVPVGAVAAGATFSSDGSDRPELSVLSGDTPLANTVAFLDALCALKRIRMSGAQKAQ